VTAGQVQSNVKSQSSCLSVKTVQTAAQLSRGNSKTETALKRENHEIQLAD